MIQFIFVLSALLWSSLAVAQDQEAVVSEAKKLVDARKYESAFEVLDHADPHNASPTIVLLKEHILLEYFAKSVMHTLFTLKDLDAGEKLSDIRTKSGSYSAHLFPADSIIAPLIKKTPDNYSLYKGLGDYYYSALTHYSENWLLDDSTLFERIRINYRKAAEHGLGEANMYFAMGYSGVSLKDYPHAIEDFLKAISLRQNYVDAEYNLGYAYMLTNDFQNAIRYGSLSIEHYKDPENKVDAARLVAESYIELNDPKNAVLYYEMADSIVPRSYETLKALVALYLKTGNKKEPSALDRFYNLAPEKPTIYNDLSEIFEEANKSPLLLTYFKQQLPHFSDKKKIEGTLDFYIGRLYNLIDKKQSREYFMKAKEIFLKIYEPDNKVFEAIEDGLMESQKN